MRNIHVIFCDRSTLVRYLYWEHGVRAALTLLKRPLFFKEGQWGVPFVGSYQGTSFSKAAVWASRVREMAATVPGVANMPPQVQVVSCVPEDVTTATCREGQPTFAGVS